MTFLIIREAARVPARSCQLSCRVVSFAKFIERTIRTRRGLFVHTVHRHS